MDKKYVALKKMMIPNPNEIPSTLRVEPGGIFSLDGSEGLNVTALLQCKVIKEYKEPKKRKLYLAPEEGEVKDGKTTR